MNDEIERYKTRLIAKWFNQQDGIYCYKETFSMVAKLDTITYVITLAANYNWKLF